MRKLAINNVETVKLAIRQEITRSEDARYEHRLHALLLICEGMSSNKVAKLFGQSPRTIQYWVNRFNRHGFDGLFETSRPGRPSALDEELLAKVGKDLRKSPTELGYTQGFWDGKLLSHHLQEVYRVELGVRQCQRLFRKLGFRRRKPRPMIANSDPALKRAFKKKKLKRLRRDKGVDLWALDGCIFQQHGSRCEMWVPPEEKDPQLLHAPTRKHVCMYGAVQVATCKLLTQECERFDAMVFQNFLMTLVREHDGKRRIHLILDNAKYHHAILLEPFLEEHKDKLVLEFLPPYSPDLNPIERVWRLTRRLCVHNRYFAILSDLVKVVYAQFSLWTAPNDALRRLCAIN